MVESSVIHASTQGTNKFVTTWKVEILITMHLQEIGENVLMAFDTLRTHKVRSALTMLGVIGGTMTVIAISSFFDWSQGICPGTNQAVWTRYSLRYQVGQHRHPLQSSHLNQSGPEKT
jgi:hypothetical protein